MTDHDYPLAFAQAANHRTELLLDRCRHGHMPLAGSQSGWHADQQTHFLAWLDNGGFAKENSGIAPLFSAPQRDLYEESKFSLLRIDDAA